MSPEELTNAHLIGLAGSVMGFVLKIAGRIFAGAIIFTLYTVFAHTIITLPEILRN
jgi:hypothetical protein